jgi:hypothetical protein
VDAEAVTDPFREVKMNRWCRLLAIGGVCAVAGCSEAPITAPSSPDATSMASGAAVDVVGAANLGSHAHGMLLFSAAGPFLGDGPGGQAGGRASTSGMVYHGGPVILAPKIVAVYWAGSTIYSGGPAAGATGSGTQDGSLIGFFLRNLGGSAYWNINTTYYNAANAHVQNSLAYTGFWAANVNVPASGSSVSDAGVQGIVATGLSSGKLTYDPGTIYAVFSASGVNLGGGFGTQYCAYHGHFTWNGNDVKYAAMPYDYQFPSACSALSGSPNGDFPADAEVNTLAHETEEFTTDPDLNAWYDRRGNENADKCAWTFGTTFTSNGAVANMTLGGKSFLVQQNWKNTSSAGCALHL